MSSSLALSRSQDLFEIIRLERRAFAAKVRMARAVLGWSQSELGLRVGLTQRAIHKLEQGETEPRRSTVYAIEIVWREAGLEFEDFDNGGFRVHVAANVLDRSIGIQSRRHTAGLQQFGIRSAARARDHRS